MRALLKSAVVIYIICCSCIRNYVPDNTDYEEMLVVEGLITDQPVVNTIKLTKSQPLWKKLYPKPLTGCVVTISDDLGQTYKLKETTTFGVYITDPAVFYGVPGRVYTLHIRTTMESVNLNYESEPMKMIAVPPIDSMYYDKKILEQTIPPSEGCNIYLNTRDPSGDCRFYRWEYSETWEFHIPFNFPNKVCWITNSPKDIQIKNVSELSEASIKKHQVLSVPDPVDRLSVKYSILVNQYSMNEDEFLYWERFRNIMEETGGLYDLVPADIPNNIYCIEQPAKKVLGYFCVSAVTSRRLFIKDNFSGTNNMYNRCYSDTIFTNRPDTIAGLGWDGWLINDNSHHIPPYVVYTTDRGCIDCRTRGSSIKPAFWDDDK